MDLDFAVLADGVNQRPDGKLDIFGAGIDNITAKSVPARHLMLNLAVRFRLSSHEAQHDHHLLVVMMGADEEIARAEATIGAVPQDILDHIPVGARIGLGANFGFANLVFPTFGSYSFNILWDGTEVRSPIPLTLRPSEPEPA